MNYELLKTITMQFAIVKNIFDKQKPEIQKIIDEMIGIIMDVSSDEEEKEQALAVIMEALFYRSKKSEEKQVIGN